MVVSLPWAAPQSHSSAPLGFLCGPLRQAVSVFFCCFCFFAVSVFLLFFCFLTVSVVAVDVVFSAVFVLLFYFAISDFFMAT